MRTIIFFSAVLIRTGSSPMNDGQIEVTAYIVGGCILVDVWETLMKYYINKN